MRSGRDPLFVALGLCVILLTGCSATAQPPDEKSIRAAIIEDLKKNNKDYGADELSFSGEPTISITKVGDFEVKGQYYPVLATVTLDTPMMSLVLVNSEKGSFRLSKDTSGKWGARFIRNKK